MLFGEQQYDDLQDLIEIVIDNGAAPMIANNVINEFRRQPIRNGPNLVRDVERIVKLAVAGTGIAGAVVGHLTRSVYNWATHTTPQGGEMTNKRNQDQLVELDTQGNIIRQRTDDTQLIPQSDTRMTRARDRARLDTRAANNNNVDMGDEPMPEAGIMAARSSNGQGPIGSKETMVSPYPSLSYGLQETHTTILPWTGWLSAVALTKNGGSGATAKLEIRMNSIWDMISLIAVADGGADTAFGTTGISGAVVGASGKQALSGTLAFPKRFTSGGTEAVERPAWRDYWAQFYQFYTVLGCEWELVVNNPCHHMDYKRITGTLPVATGVTTGAATQANVAHTPAWVYEFPLSSNAIAAIQYDSYTENSGSTANVMPATNFEQILAYKNIRWEKIPDKDRTTVIKGSYKPGDIKKNIANDGDVKTWTWTAATGAPTGTAAQIPQLKDNLTVYFFQDALNTTDQPVGVNIQINLRYMVQFKDLKQQARYPNTVTTDQDITVTLNESLSATGAAYMLWT